MVKWLRGLFRIDCESAMESNDDDDMGFEQHAEFLKIRNDLFWLGDIILHEN